MQFSKIWFNHFKGFPNVTHHLLSCNTFSLFVIQISFMVYFTFLHVLTPVPWVGDCKYFLEGEIACEKRNHFYKSVNLPGLYFLTEMHNERSKNRRTITSYNDYVPIVYCGSGIRSGALIILSHFNPTGKYYFPSNGEQKESVHIYCQGNFLQAYKKMIKRKYSQI